MQLGLTYLVTMKEVEKSFDESLTDSAPFFVPSFFLLCGPDILSFSSLIVLSFLEGFAILSSSLAFCPLLYQLKIII